MLIGVELHAAMLLIAWLVNAVPPVEIIELSNFGHQEIHIGDSCAPTEGVRLNVLNGRRNGHEGKFGAEGKGFFLYLHKSLGQDSNFQICAPAEGVLTDIKDTFINREENNILIVFKRPRCNPHNIQSINFSANV